MQSLLSVWRKELRSATGSPVAVGAILFFLLLTGIWFLWISQFLVQNTASLRGYFATFPVAFTILIPAITMRTWAEERKLGSQELLLTLPVKTGYLVAGKFLGAWTIVLAMLVLTLPMTFMVTGLGNFEIGEIVGEYLGIVFLSAAATALGVFLSGLTTNTISAFLLSVAGLLLFAVGGSIAAIINLPNAVVEGIRFFSLDSRYSTFQRGILDSRDALYFVWFTALFLYLNSKILILRKWK
ncbi:MAG: ABC transporter permease [Spirochaetales bacterium]